MFFLHLPETLPYVVNLHGDDCHGYSDEEGEDESALMYLPVAPEVDEEDGWGAEQVKTYTFRFGRFYSDGRVSRRSVEGHRQAQQFSFLLILPRAAHFHIFVCYFLFAIHNKKYLLQFLGHGHILTYGHKKSL